MWIQEIKKCHYIVKQAIPHHGQKLYGFTVIKHQLIRDTPQFVMDKIFIKNLTLN